MSGVGAIVFTVSGVGAIVFTVSVAGAIVFCRSASRQPRGVTSAGMSTSRAPGVQESAVRVDGPDRA